MPKKRRVVSDIDELRIEERSFYISTLNVFTIFFRGDVEIWEHIKIFRRNIRGSKLESKDLVYDAREDRKRGR